MKPVGAPVRNKFFTVLNSSEAFIARYENWGYQYIMGPVIRQAYLGSIRENVRENVTGRLEVNPGDEA